MSTSQKFPLDYDAIERGDVIETDVLHDIARGYNIEPEKDPDRFRLLVLQLAEEIRTALRRRGFGDVSVSCRKDGIAILRDGIEQASYCGREKQRAMRMFVRRHVEESSVNPALLTDEQRRKWLVSQERGAALRAFMAPSRTLPPVGQQKLSEPEGAS